MEFKGMKKEKEKKNQLDLFKCRKNIYEHIVGVMSTDQFNKLFLK